MFSVFHKLDKNYLSYFQSLNHGFLGNFFHLTSVNENWLPLFLVLLFLIFKYEKKNFVHILIFIGLILFFSEQIISGTIKNLITKLNPYRAIDLNWVVNNIGNYVGKIGFVSTQSVNSFAISFFLVLILKKKFKKIHFLFVWPILISISQCVLKVHNINDVCSGGTIGSLIGVVFFFIYKKRKIFVKKIMKYFVKTNLFK